MSTMSYDDIRRISRQEANSAVDAYDFSQKMNTLFTTLFFKDRIKADVKEVTNDVAHDIVNDRVATELLKQGPNYVRSEIERTFPLYISSHPIFTQAFTTHHNKVSEMLSTSQQNTDSIIRDRYKQIMDSLVHENYQFVTQPVIDNLNTRVNLECSDMVRRSEHRINTFIKNKETEIKTEIELIQEKSRIISKLEKKVDTYKLMAGSSILLSIGTILFMLYKK